MTSCPQAYHAQIERSVDTFIQCMRQSEGQSIDFTIWPWYWAFDLTYAILFGSYFGFMDSRSDFNGMIDSFTKIVRPAVLLGQIPQWVPLSLGNNAFMTFMRKFQTFPDPTQEFLKVYRRLVRDVRSDNVNVGTHPNEPQERLLKLPFLTAVIKESLRLYTSNCPPMERIVPSPGIEASGYRIPEGTVVSVAHYVAHRDKDVYGEDADLFRPERWLEADASTLKRMDHSFMAFGKGNRACVGRELGMLEMRLFVIRVLRNFDVEWANANPQPQVQMYWVMEQFGMDIRFKNVVRDAVCTNR
ncbi:MAG: hypothetical protein Q9160_006027 [Pyrenula sp. 1 TL-2023]